MPRRPWDLVERLLKPSVQGGPGGSGKMRVNVYTKEGEHLKDVDLDPRDLVLMFEGHSIEFLEPGTKAIEIKEGPFPESDAADKVDF